jgi:hypothetical protein
MKTKLLKKVRRRYRIRENRLGKQWIEYKKFGLIWDKLPPWDQFIIDRLCEGKTIEAKLKFFLHSEYLEYSMKYKIIKRKENQVKTISK